VLKMTITPNDIQNKQFERAFRGYDIEDVDDFLDQIARDLEQMIRENKELKDQVEQLQEKNKSYQKMEETMHNAIVVAQETADEVKQNAKREADLIRREAEREAKQILEDSRYRISRLLGEHEELLKRARVFKMRFRSFMESQLVALESESWLEEQKPDKRIQGIEKSVDFNGKTQSNDAAPPSGDKAIGPAES
jgi:cell division initiation protein